MGGKDRKAADDPASDKNEDLQPPDPDSGANLEVEDEVVSPEDIDWLEIARILDEEAGGDYGQQTKEKAGLRTTGIDPNELESIPRTDSFTPAKMTYLQRFRERFEGRYDDIDDTQVVERERRKEVSANRTKRY